MNDKQLDCKRAVNILKAINLLDQVYLEKAHLIVDKLEKMLSKRTQKLADKYGMSSREIDKLLYKAKA